MAAFTIPRGHQTRFKVFKRVVLDNKSVQELLLVLGEETSVIEDPELSSKIASRVTTISPRDIDDVIEVLIVLYLLQARYESPVSEFAEDICRAMDESDVEELRLSDDERSRFKDRLIELLHLEAVSVGAKAIDLQRENERTFSDARIVTDIRPIFGTDLEETPAQAVIVHILKISYRERNRSRDFFVALDAADVSTLSRLLDRANSKAGNLKSFLDRTEMSYVNIGDEE